MLNEENKKISTPGRWFAELDENGNVINAVYDKSYCKILGYDSDTAIFKDDSSWKGRIHPDDAERVGAHHAEVLEKHPEGMDLDIEYRMKTANGYRWFHDYARCTRREDGSIVRADGVVFDIQDTVDREMAQKELAQNNARILALEESLESIYDINLETGSYEVYMKGKTLGDIKSRMTNNNDFFEDNLKNVEKVVFEEDRDGVRKALSRDYIQKKLNENSTFDWYYRILSGEGPVWVKMRILYKDSEKHNIIIGVYNAEKEVADGLKAKQVRKEQIAKMAGGISAYIVNPKTGRFQIINQNEYLSENYSSNEDFKTSISRYIEKDVFEPDKKKARDAINISTFVSNLEMKDEYTFRYRDISSGTPRWYEMRAVKLSDTEILYGFKDKDDEINEQLVFEKLRETYFGLYYINLDSGHAQILKTGHPEITGEAGSVVQYSDLLRNIAAASEGDAADFLNRISDIQYIKQSFLTEELGSYIYKSHIFEGNRWVNCTGLVLARHENGSPSVFALGFNLLDDESSEKEEARLKLHETTDKLEAENHHNRVLNQITKSGSWIFIVGEDDSIINSEVAPECYTVIQNEWEDENEWFKLIHPEDSEHAMQAFYSCLKDHTCQIPFDVECRIKSRDGDYHWIHSAGRMKRNSDGSGEFYGICSDIDDTVKRREEEQRILKKAEETQKLIDSITSDYHIAYIVNMADDSLEVRKMEQYVIEKNENFKTFTQMRNFTLSNVIHPSDRKRIAKELDFSFIRQRLSKGPSYRIEYKVYNNGATFWGEMVVTSMDEDRIIIGMTGKETDYVKRHLAEKGYGEYLALFTIDLDTRMIQPVKISPLFKTATVGTAVPYEVSMKKFASIYHGEALDFFTRISSIDYLKKEFVKDDRRSFSYKSERMSSDKWIDVAGNVIDRHEDGTPAVLTLGFTVVDSFATLRNELQSKLTEDMQIIGGLASRFDTLYFFNIDNGTFKVYSLDGKKHPEANLIVNKGGSPLEILHRYGASDLIHSEDKALFTEISTESIRARLAHSKSFKIRFRRYFGDEFHWSEMEVIKYEEIDEQANAIAIGFVDLDAEIRSEQALSRCFGILGKGLSPQKSIDELLSIAGDFYGAERCYIFEFSQNGETLDNTYEWCANGIEPMISHLQGVPSQEVEGWKREFERHGAFHMDSLDADSAYGTEEGRALLEMQGISSLIAAPIMNGNEIEGFIGVDNPTKAKTNLSILKQVSVVAYSEILQRKENDEEHITLEKLSDTFLSVYYADLSHDYLHNWKIDEDYKEAYRSVESYSVSMGGYVREGIAERDRERCIEMTSPESVLRQFKDKDRFSVDMTDILLGYERSVVFDFVKVNETGSQFVMCCRDVTATLEKEKEQKKLLEEARNAAEAANRSKTSFLFNMSHDIRTPMNAITGFTMMAKKYVDDKDKVNDYLDKIDTSGQQLLSLVNQVLEMARIESGKVELDNKPVNVQEEYNSMVTVLSEQALVSGLEFHHSLHDVVHNKILADKARMGSITLNICGNAMKYTPKGGRIDFSLKEIPCRKPGFATFVFTVSDTGIGMSKEYLKELYEPFSREKSTTVSKIQGTGLGMSIVKQLLDLMGGNIEVHSEIGKGSRFDITVDFKIDDEEKANDKIEMDSIRVTLSGRKVLLVEDNEMNREIATDILQEEGLLVEEADDGVTAVDILKQKGPDYYDFVLMDIQMPIMGGYEATREIRKMYPDARLPIIALSANAFEEDKAVSIASGMNDHVAKPINVKELFKVLEKHL